MSLKDNFAAGFDRLNRIAGKQIRIRYFTQTIGSVWDDEVTLAQSGTDLWTSGIVLPLDNRSGSTDSVLVEQGKLIDDDQKLFVTGSLNLTGSELQVKIGLGSPAAEEFTLVPLGAISAEVQDQKIYRKAFIRRLTTGSILGEG